MAIDTPKPDSATPSRPTLHTIAQLAGVSHQTVSNVLNAPERVAPNTREKVLAVVERLNYRPNSVARSLALRSTRLISLRVGDGKRNEASILDPFMRELARIGSEHGYRIVLDYADKTDEAQIASFEDLYARTAVDGVVVVETHVGDRRPAWLLAHHVPFVAFGRPWGDLGSPHAWVDVDIAHGMRLVVEHLRGLGHSRIAYIGPPLDGGLEDARFGGFADAMAATGEPFDDALLCRAAEPSKIRTSLRRMLKTKRRPTALACRDDSYAVEASHVVTDLGLTVGGDVAVAGFDDSELARRAQLPLTSVTQPISEVAALIWKSLLAQISGAPAPPLHQVIAPELVVRASTTGA